MLSRQGPRPAAPGVRIARAFIERHFVEPLQLRDLAEAANLSPFYLQRAFRAAYRESPHQFLTRRRLQRARVLLAAGDPVTDVCFAVGYNSLGTFSALFRRHVGSSPQAYRRRIHARRNGQPFTPLCFAVVLGVGS